MGLTIHWTLSASGSVARARQLVRSLHRAATRLPFNQVGPIIELPRERCRFGAHPRGSLERYLLGKATKRLFIKRYHTAYREYSLVKEIHPVLVIGFQVVPADGSEWAAFGLCRYPAERKSAGSGPDGNADGWSWSTFCKTQYASNPELGGVANFLRAHLALIALLDKAESLRLLEDVEDEGGFYYGRDLRALAAGIQHWNEDMAALAGGFKDCLEGLSPRLTSAIHQFRNFEHLEAAGHGRFPGA